MNKALQWIQELLSSWGGGAREISRTHTSFTLTADAGTSAAWGIKKTTCVYKLDHCKSLQYHRARTRWGCPPRTLGAFAVPSSWAVLELSPILVLRVLCQVSIRSQDQAALHKDTAKGSFSPASTWYNPNNTQAAGMTHNKEQGEGKQISSKILVNKRLIKSLLVLSLAALTKSLQTWKQK